MIIAHHRHKFPDPVWDADLALWFEAAALPEEPFELYSGVSVVDARKCYEALRSDVALGPQGLAPGLRLLTVRLVM